MLNQAHYISGLFQNHLTGTAVAIVLMLFLTLVCKKFYIGFKLGYIPSKTALKYMAALFFVYLSFSVLGHLLERPKENFVTTIFDGDLLTKIQIALTIFLLAPVGEEIVFRGFLLNPFGQCKIKIQVIVAIVFSLIFSFLHTQYTDPLTISSLFFFSFIASIARFKTGGLLLPIILHIEAAVLAVTFNILF